jgi:hypothetical protein
VPSKIRSFSSLGVQENLCICFHTKKENVCPVRLVMRVFNFFLSVFNFFLSVIAKVAGVAHGVV